MSSIIDATVPPDTPPANERTTRLVSLSCPVPSCSAWRCSEDGQIRRDGVESARIDDARTGVDGLLVMHVDAFADEYRFTRQVGVVGTGCGAGGYQWQSVTEVRPDRGHHHAGLGRHRVQGRRLRCVGGDQRPRYCVLVE